MKKSIIFAMFLTGLVGQAQIKPTAEEKRGRVSINTEEPRASFEVARHRDIPEERPQGVLFPSFTTEQRSKFTASRIVKGTMIYNTDKECLEMYMGLINGIAQWSCLPDANNSANQNVSALGDRFTGTYIEGVTLGADNTVVFTLQNNSFAKVEDVDFSQAVTVENIGGASAVPISVDGTANNKISIPAGATATLIYKLSGQPVEGLLTARFNRLGITADISMQVGLGTATIPNKTEYIVSLIYENTEVQGIANNTDKKVSIKIPYTAGQGWYRAVTAEQNTASGQGGDLNKLTLEIPAGNFATQGELTATLTVDGDTNYLVKMLPPGEDYTIATFPIDMNGTKYDLILKGIGGIPDRCFGKTTLDCVGYGANEKEHEFIYIPITGPDGRTWLSNNLGAEYANVNSPHFSPTTQAGGTSTDPTTIKTDWKAYGSLFQWQRNPDGHELVNWTGSTATEGTIKHGYSATRSNSWTNPDTNESAGLNGLNMPWVNDSLNSTGPHNLWQTGGSTNPCPAGYHVPTTNELLTLQDSITKLNTPLGSLTGSNAMWSEVVLRFPAAGLHGSSYHFSRQGTVGHMWSSEWVNRNSQNTFQQQNLTFTSVTSTITYYGYSSYGMAVRCIKDQ